ncbi:hypothetical protein GALMADRAFT_145871 [Galerina marginata CBS 339.88]|uniref:Uncharacterized protein n=1 Tax=Galerina marginata (strain CBS 339.88) TaxID=685588 RepID=A0A067SFQ9_GALM3|nr:hypothetical protein GALMADRAFT_145871 [Galerina marginata CBS 339.88]
MTLSTATLPPALLEKSEITEKQLKEVHDTIANLSNDSDVRKDVRKTLETMGKRVVAMEADFARVHASVEIFDGLGVVLDRNGQVIRFAPGWKSLYDEYTYIMEKSQQAAIVVDAKIQDLLDVYLPLVESNVSAGKKELRLNEYIAGLEEFVKTGTANANRFTRFRENVIAFQKNLHDITPSNIANVKEQLKGFDEDFQNLEEGFRVLEKVLVELLYNDAIKLKEGLVNVNKPVPSTGNADDDEEQAIFNRLRMKSLKTFYITLQDALNTYALSVAPA